MSEVGATKEGHWVLVLGVGVVGRHLEEVCGELRLLEPAAGDVGMGCDHIAPWGEPLERLAFGWLGCRLAPFGTPLFIEDLALKVSLELLNDLDLVASTHRL